MSVLKIRSKWWGIGMTYGGKPLTAEVFTIVVQKFNQVNSGGREKLVFEDGFLCVEIDCDGLLLNDVRVIDENAKKAALKIIIEEMS